MADLTIIQFPASDMANFSYLLYCPETGQAAAVDPSMQPQLLVDKAAELGLSIRLLLNTHGHADHITGNPYILEHTAALLAAHPADMSKADIALEEGSRLQLGEHELLVLHTPGHTPGSVTFRTAHAIITGDTLFVGRCGRADLPGSDVNQLYDSLQRLKKLPSETVVYPGHDYGPNPTSTIAWECGHNEFLRCPDRESFIKLRMG